MTLPRPTFRLAAAAFALLSLAACSQSQTAASPAPPPVAVGTVAVRPEPMPVVNELPGRIAPTQIAEVRPRVSGIIVQRVFEQGAVVKQGDVLYRIDPAPFQVQVESTQASLQRAKSAQLLAGQLADRQKELRQRNISSAQDLDSALAQLAQADADVAVAQAGLDAARLSLQYAEVKAPISGRIGRALITEGALVSATGAENLATIQRLDSVYADFTQSSQDLMNLRQAQQKGLLKGPGPGQASVQLLFDDGTQYGQPGKLLFSDSTVDETTGQIIMRAEFPNPDGDLLPGLYVRVRLQQGVEQAALAVPQQAIQRDTSGHAQLYIVGKDNVAALLTVETGRTNDGRTIITKGLQAGDQVVVEGFQKLHPGATVSPSEWKPPAPPAAAPATAG